jgi:cation transporter-like permease
MDKGSPIDSCPNPRRAARKLALLCAVIVAVLALLIVFVNERTVNGLINHLSLSLLVALIVIVNLLALLTLIGLYAAFRWIKRDFDPDSRED